MLIGTSQRMQKRQNFHINYNDIEIEFVKQKKKMLSVYIHVANALSWEVHILFIAKKKTFCNEKSDLYAAKCTTRGFQS